MFPAMFSGASSTTPFVGRVVGHVFFYGSNLWGMFFFMFPKQLYFSFLNIFWDPPKKTAVAGHG